MQPQVVGVVDADFLGEEQLEKLEERKKKAVPATNLTRE